MLCTALSGTACLFLLTTPQTEEHEPVDPVKTYRCADDEVL